MQVQNYAPGGVDSFLLSLLFAFIIGNRFQIVFGEESSQGSKGGTVIVYECQSESSSTPELTLAIEDPSLRFKAEDNVDLYTFRYERNSQPLGCSTKSNFLTIYIPAILTTREGDNNIVLTSDTEAHLKKRKVSFLSSGQLRVGDGKGLSVFYEPNEYCIRRVNSTHTEFQVCTSHCSHLNQHQHQNAHSENADLKNGNEICVKKCCAPGFTVSYHKSKSKNLHSANEDEILVPSCEPSGDKHWKPTLWNSKVLRDRNILERVEPEEEPRSRIIWVQNEKCHNSLHQPRTKIHHQGTVLPSFRWHLLDNGSIVILNKTMEDSDLDTSLVNGPQDILKLEQQWIILSHPFCIDGIHDFQHDAGSQYEYAGHQRRAHQLISVCYDALFSNGSDSTLDGRHTTIIRNLGAKDKSVPTTGSNSASTNTSHLLHFYNYCLLLIILVNNYAGTIHH